MQLPDPVVNQLRSGAIDFIRTGRRHLACAPQAHPVIKDGALGIAGGDQEGLDDPKTVVNRRLIQDSLFTQRGFYKPAQSLSFRPQQRSRAKRQPGMTYYDPAFPAAFSDPNTSHSRM